VLLEIAPLVLQVQHLEFRSCLFDRGKFLGALDGVAVEACCNQILFGIITSAPGSRLEMVNDEVAPGLKCVAKVPAINAPSFPKGLSALTKQNQSEQYKSFPVVAGIPTGRHLIGLWEKHIGAGICTPQNSAPFFCFYLERFMEDRELSEREAAARGLPSRMPLHPYEEISWFEGAADESDTGRQGAGVEIPRRLGARRAVGCTSNLSPRGSSQ
jgi:hypothetical protein